MPQRSLPAGTNKDPLRIAAMEPATSGLLTISHGPLLVASHPILTSAHSGAPHGLLVMGRLLD